MTMLPMPTYADILQDRRAANNSPTAIGSRTIEPGDLPLMDKRDPCHVDYENPDRDTWGR